MVISSGRTKVGLSLSTAFRKPMARNVLATFLRHAGVDLPSLRGLGLPVPVDRLRAVAGPILARPGWPASASVRRQRQGWGRGDGAGGGGTGQRLAVRSKGRALAWATFTALALTGSRTAARHFRSSSRPFRPLLLPGGLGGGCGERANGGGAAEMPPMAAMRAVGDGRCRRSGCETVTGADKCRQATKFATSSSNCHQFYLQTRRRNIRRPSGECGLVAKPQLVPINVGRRQSSPPVRQIATSSKGEIDT